MIPTVVRLYLNSKERIVQLRKIVRFASLPRTREFVKFRNREGGDYFAFTVMQITHHEQGCPEIVVQLRTKTQDRNTASFLPDEELDSYAKNYANEGWAIVSHAMNKTICPDGSSGWDAVMNETM